MPSISPIPPPLPPLCRLPPPPKNFFYFNLISNFNYRRSLLIDWYRLFQTALDVRSELVIISKTSILNFKTRRFDFLKAFCYNTKKKVKSSYTRALFFIALSNYLILQCLARIHYQYQQHRQFLLSYHYV
jgi:hypothetical protein